MDEWETFQNSGPKQLYHVIWGDAGVDVGVFTRGHDVVHFKAASL
jgi:hypothetical protein